MRGRYLQRFGALFLAVLLGCVPLTLLSSATAQAQRRVVIVRTYRPFYRPWWRSRGLYYDPYFDYYSRYGQYVFSNSDAAYRHGYDDGLKTGAGDVKHRRSYDPQRSHYFQEAGFGNFGEVYRSGFMHGYADGFRS
jgi:hypothetical protein